VLSIGRLGSGRAAADYYLNRQAGCELDYYTGRGERTGAWCGSGAAALGLSGELDELGEGRLRALLDGCDENGQRLVAPVWRTAPAAQLPAAPLVEAIESAAAGRGVDAVAFFGSNRDADAYAGLIRRLDRAGAAGRRLVTVRADAAARLAGTAGLDPVDVFRGPDGTDRFSAAVAQATERVDTRRAGLDLTFSAPKSVSLLYGLGEPTVAEQVREAHHAALTGAVEYLQRQAATGLRGHHGPGSGGRRVDTDGLIAVAFEHRSSRAGDPQLHTHVVVANLARGVDGRWGAIDTGAIYRHALTAGYVYQALLRGGLTGRLGVTWTAVRRGTAEIDGIPAGLRRLFSRRRAAIEAELARVGRDDPAAAQRATLITRPAKPRTDARTLRQSWVARAVEAGHDLSVLDAALHRTEPPPVPNPAGVANRLAAADGLTRDRSSFDRRDLLRAICESIPAGANVDLTGLRNLATAVVRDRQVVPLLAAAGADRRRYATTDLLAVEHRALELVEARRAEPTGLVPTDTVASVLATAGLTDEQSAAVRALTGAPGGVAVLAGPAGAGKTATLSAAREAWQRAGHVVIGTALAAIAARTLERSAGIRSGSLTKLLAELTRVDQDTLTPVGLPDRAVLVVDEASMVGTRQLARLFELTAASGAKLVLVGDPAQLPEIEAGGLFAALARRPESIRLRDNQRQQADWERAALARLRAGDVRAAVDGYLAHDRIHPSVTTEQARARIVADYLAATTAADVDVDVVMLTSRRADARSLNDTVRAHLYASGVLGDEALTVRRGSRELEFRAGDRVVVTRNDYRRALLNGTRGRVTSVDLQKAELTVVVDDGRAVCVPAGWLAAGHLTYGYALTCHRAQGLTVDVALLYGTAALYREAGYVGLSRGRRANYVYASLDGLRRDTNPDVDHLADPGPAADQVGDVVLGELAGRLTLSRAQRLATDIRDGGPTTAAAARHRRQPMSRRSPDRHASIGR
jgi:conjugative relaxase-like TrwC/TraI family protein